MRERRPIEPAHPADRAFHRRRRAASLTVALGAVLATLLAARTDPSPQSRTAKELAGAYVIGADEGTLATLRLEPGGRFAFEWGACSARWAENEGRFEVSGSTLRLLGRRVAELHAGSPGLPAEWEIVETGGRVYLVPAPARAEFIAALKAGAEPRREAWGRFFLRDGDWTKDARPSATSR